MFSETKYGTDTSRIDPEFFNQAAITALKLVNSNETLGDYVQDGYRVVYETTEAIDREEGERRGLPYFLQSANISTPFVNWGSMICVSEADWIRYQKGRIQPGELLIEVKGKAEKIALVPDSFPPKTLVTGTCFKLTTKQPSDRYFLAAYLICKYGQALKDRLKSNLLVAYIAKNDLYGLPVPTVSSSFKLEIKRCFDAIFVAQELAQKQMMEAEHSLTQKLGLDSWTPPTPLSYVRSSSEAFTAGRLDAEFFSPKTNAIRSILKAHGDIPLGELCEVSTGFAWKSDRFIERGNTEGLPFVRIRDCKPGAIYGSDLDRLPKQLIDEAKQPSAQEGDLVVGMDGLKWFYSSLLQDSCYINQRVAWLHSFSQDYSSAYLMMVVNSIIGQSQLLSEMTIAQTVGHITLENLRALRIPCLNKEARSEIHRLVIESLRARQRATQLLEAAKRAVEIAIEDSETAALAYLQGVV